MRRLAATGAALALLMAGCTSAEERAARSEAEADTQARAIAGAESYLRTANPSPASPKIIPNLSLLALDVAEDKVRDLGMLPVGTDCSGRDRGVWNASNWFVVDQDPAAGDPVVADGEVWLCSMKYDD